MTTFMDTELIELAERGSDGVRVRLLWRRGADEVVLEVSDEHSGDNFEVDVPGARALDAFRHPFVYVSSTGAGVAEAFEGTAPLGEVFLGWWRGWLQVALEPAPPPPLAATATCPARTDPPTTQHAALPPRLSGAGGLPCDRRPISARLRAPAELAFLKAAGPPWRTPDAGRLGEQPFWRS